MTYQTDVTTDTPGTYQRFEETSGTNLADTSGNGRAATIGTATGLTMGVAALAGIGGNSLTCAGAHSITIASPSWLNSLTSFSIEAWVKTTSTAVMGIAGRENTGAAVTSLDRMFQFRWNAGKLEWLWLNTAGTVLSVASVLTYNDGIWHHVVGRWNGTSMNLVVDNVQVATLATSGSWKGSGGTTPFTIASLWTTAAANQLTGSIDELAVYPNIYLSDTRVGVHWATGTSVRPESRLDRVFLAALRQGTPESRLDRVFAASLIRTPSDARLAGLAVQVARSAPAAWPPVYGAGALASSAPDNLFQAETITVDRDDTIVAWVDQGTLRTDCNVVTGAPFIGRNATPTGFPTYRSDGNDGFSVPTSSSGAAQSLLAVCKATSLSGLRTLWGTTVGGLALQTSGGVIAVSEQGVSSIANGNTIVVNQWYIIGCTYDATNYSIWQDGVKTHSGTHAAGALTAGQTRRLGSLTNSQWWLGDIPAAAAWNRVLSDTEMINITAEWRKKYIGAGSYAGIKLG